MTTYADVDCVRRLFTSYYRVGQKKACLRQQLGILRLRTFLATAHHQHFEIRVEHAQGQLRVLGDAPLDAE
jgi:hypothetical protein